jgi:hypothetical protein
MAKAAELDGTGPIQAAAARTMGCIAGSGLGQDEPANGATDDVAQAGLACRVSRAVPAR